MQPFARRLSVLCFAMLAWSFAGGLASAQREINAEAYNKISKAGPFTADLTTVAKINIPEGFRFVNKANIKKFNDLENERTGPLEVGAIFPQPYQGWYIIFSDNQEGYVKDDEKKDLDADKILAAMREGQEEDNKERKREGKVALTLPGWEKAPFFDDLTKNLTWGLKVAAVGQPGYSVNYQARILGRRGYTSATLVCSPDDLKELIPVFDKMITGLSYKPNEDYSAWTSGDKVAAVGLTGLIAGGAGLLAAKTGLLQVLLKGGKVVILAIGAAIAGIIGFFKKLFGRGSTTSD
jgi:uncharacterized membrane-anchored protein